MNSRTASAIRWLAGALFGIDTSVALRSQPVSWTAAGRRAAPVQA